MKFIGSEEVQERLGISRPTLYLWVRQGKLKPQRAGRSLRFDETQIERLLGQGPRVAVWVRGGGLEEARREVARQARGGARASFLLEYLGEPGANFVRGRVLPGGLVADDLLEALRRRDHVFLSHEESAWALHDVRTETSPSGEPYLAVELKRSDGPGEGDERDRRLQDFLRTMRAGLTERVDLWARDKLHERGPD
ncbi:MAG TPA: helix-turn-helix domain-containing protein [Planctomycetota bacterium]|nr:helix-turn-helix domain-containing protein [Planctomycetota bacterium]